jgi:hypothetical protein
MILHLAEFVPGVVAFLDPEVLIRFGAHCLRPESDRVVGVHPMVCVDVLGDESVWAVLSSKDTYNRLLRIPAISKRGHPSWTMRDSHVYGYNHVWRGPNFAFQEASLSDKSSPSLRNSVSSAMVERIRSVINRAAFGT